MIDSLLRMGIHQVNSTSSVDRERGIREWIYSLFKKTPKLFVVIRQFFIIFLFIFYY